jgi:hypothetical protein
MCVEGRDDFVVEVKFQGVLRHSTPVGCRKTHADAAFVQFRSHGMKGGHQADAVAVGALPLTPVPSWLVDDAQSGDAGVMLGLDQAFHQSCDALREIVYGLGRTV